MSGPRRRRDPAQPRQAGALVAPSWRRVRFWLAVAVVIALGAVSVTALDRSAAAPLDPSSASHSGAKALATVLRGYGVSVARTRTVDAAGASGGAVVVPFPESVSADDLRRLRDGVRLLVLIDPNPDRFPDAPADNEADGPTPPDCDWPGALAAGTVDLPIGTRTFTARTPAAGAVSCYGGAYLHVGNVVLLGSADLLRNDHVAGEGVAALDVNALTDDRAVTLVTWLLPGGAAAPGQPTASVWSLFPDGIHRATLWVLIALGLALALWRGRRFGPVVLEPLPVVVRSAEVVEGHGRLYRRAGARDRAAAALRAGARHRLAGYLGLPRHASQLALVTAVAEHTGRPPAEVDHLLAGGPPADDQGLVTLAKALDALERAAGVPASMGRPTEARKGTTP